MTQQVLQPPAKAAVFLVLTVHEGAEDDVRSVLADLPGLTRGVGFRAPDDELSAVVGIGAPLWDRLYDVPPPPGLHPFVELVGSKHTAVSTQGDLLVHLRARRADLTFELAKRITDRLAGAVTVADEVHGFTYFDERDLLGFVDGTENPEGEEAVEAVLVGEDDAAYAGSSYVVVQKYLHDLDAWGAISVEEQERVIGRTKLEDIELSDDVKPTNSHVALNTVEDDEGNELSIVRDNMAFGNLSEREFGTYFISYARDPAVIEEMLRNMFLGKPEGNYDRILDFSVAVTGSLFFVPTVDFLESPPARPMGATAHRQPPVEREPVPPSPDGSLRIGSLRAPAPSWTTP